MRGHPFLSPDSRLPLRFLLAGALCLCAFGQLGAATFRVTKFADTNDTVCDGDCSLREAVAAANADDDIDEIILPSGFYALNGIAATGAFFGEVRISSDLELRGEGESRPVISGLGTHRVLRVDQGVTVTVRDIEITNGNALTGSGGGILALAGSELTLNNVIVSGNRASNGGGIDSSGQLVIANSVIQNNEANGVFLVLSQALEILGGDGGGVASTGQFTITDSVIEGNRAGGRGGGLAIRVLPPLDKLSSRTGAREQMTKEGNAIVNSTIADNRSSTQGGGLWAVGASVSLVNVTISNNEIVQAGGLGSGVYFEGSSSNTISFTHVTIALNSGPEGCGGLFAAGPSVSLANTILDRNTPSNCSGTIGSLGGNVSSDASCPLNQSTDLESIDPLLGTLAQNGGPTPTHLPAENSPALDRAVANVCSESDQRGLTRPQGAACDVGAVEHAEPRVYTVNRFDDAPDDDPGDGLCRGFGNSPGADCTLRAAIQEANAFIEDDEIVLPAGSYLLTRPPAGSSDDQASGDLEIVSGIRIDGDGENTTIIDGNGNDRIFEISPQAVARIDGVTIQRGAATFVGDLESSAGGAILSRGNLTLTRCLIRDSMAESGAAIFHVGTFLQMEQCTLARNSASSEGGAIAIFGTGGQLSNTILDSAIVNNSALTGGGGLMVAGAPLSLVNVTVSGNTVVDGLGGGLWLEAFQNQLSINHGTIAFNAAPSGGGVFTGQSSVSLANTILAQNSPDNCLGVIESGGGNLSSDASCSLDESLDLESIDPLLGPLARNGGPTPTHLPAESSPAVDRATDDECAPLDQRGLNRPQLSACDAGAVERAPRRAYSANSLEDLPDAAPGDGLCSVGAGSPQADCTLRAAIQEANAFIEDDEIMLPAGTYRLTRPASTAEDDQTSGDLEIVSNIMLLGDDDGETIIDGDGNDRIFEVMPGVVAQIDGITLQGGAATLIADRQTNPGGAIVNRGNLTLSRCVIRNNIAGSGGAIFNSGGLLQVSRCALAGNGASLLGGAVFNEDRVADPIFRLRGEYGPKGTQAAVPGIVNFDQVTVSGNSAASGAAVVNAGTSVELLFSTVAGNAADDGEPALLTVDVGPVTSLGHTLMANAPTIDCAGAVASLGNNLDGDGSCGLGPEELSGISDPLLGPLQDNDELGGVPLTHALLPSSPAIDAGNPDACPATDQRGGPRLTDGDGDGVGGCDIGAHEASPFQPGTVSFSIPAALVLDEPLAGFRMIGSPLIGVPSPADFVVPVLGLPSVVNWRLLRYQAAPAAYRELASGQINDPFFDFVPGRGFWMISTRAFEATVAGIPNDASGPPFALALESVAGWHQITAPFNFPMDWECIAERLPDMASDQLERYQPDLGNGGVAAYGPATELAPGEAYWFFLNEAQRASQDLEPLVAFPPLCAAVDNPAAALERKRERVKPWRPSGKGGWRVQLTVVSGHLGDRHNYFGLDALGTDATDRLDHREPPTIHGLSLYFPGSDRDGAAAAYSSDIRRLVGHSLNRKNQTQDSIQIWDFEVRSDHPGETVELSWRPIGPVPAGLLLQDRAADRWIDLQLNDGYRYTTGAGGVRRFQVILP